MRASVIAAMVAVSVAVVAAYGQPRPYHLPHTPIDATRLTHDVRVLSSDAFAGRAPANDGETRTVGYLIKRFKALGLKPGGEHGGWTQAVPLARSETTGPVVLSVADGQGTRVLVQGRDAAVASLRPVDRVEIEKAPLVFVGYGVEAPERNWNDFKDVDLHGKIAVVLVNDPDFANPSSRLFGGKAETYYGRWCYKFEEAARRGALGVLIVHETDAAGYGWTTVADAFAGPQFDLAGDAASQRLLLQGWVRRDAAVELFRRAGLDFDALERSAREPGFQPVELAGSSLSADFQIRRRRLVTYNVLARLPGAVRPAEAVVYSSHWDNFGARPAQNLAQAGQGAVDGGTGLAALLELARVYAHTPATQRSIVFAAFAAEERGGLGAEYYVRHPVYPLAGTAADINIDALQTAGPARDVVLVGAGKDTLEDDLARMATRQGRRVTPEDHPEAGVFYRGDHFAFAKKGVPVLPLTAMGGGPDLVEGGRRAGDAWLRDYVANRYHSAKDRWSPDWDLRGAALDVALVYDLGRELADSNRWPGWKPGAEFASARKSGSTAANGF